MDKIAILIEKLAGAYSGDFPLQVYGDAASCEEQGKQKYKINEFVFHNVIKEFYVMLGYCLKSVNVYRLKVHIKKTDDV